MEVPDNWSHDLWCGSGEDTSNGRGNGGGKWRCRDGDGIGGSEDVASETAKITSPSARRRSPAVLLATKPGLINPAHRSAGPTQAVPLAEERRLLMESHFDCDETKRSIHSSVQDYIEARKASRSVRTAGPKDLTVTMRR